MRQPWVAAQTAMAMSWIAGPTLANDTTIVIGCIDDLSALVAEAGNDSLNGVKLAVAEANAAGGVKGKQIKLVIYDGKVDPQLTSTFVTRAIEDDGAVAIFGGNVSGAAPGVIIIANEQHVPFFGMSAAADFLTNPSTPYYFRFGPSNSQDAAAVANLVQQSGIKRVAIISNSLPFGLDGAKAISAALKARNVEVAINEVYEVSATDITPQVVKVRDANPDAIIVWPYPADGGHVLRTMAQLKLTAPTIIARVALFEAFRKLAVETAEGAVVPNTVDTDRPDVKAMLEKFNAQFGPRPPTMYIAMGYDGAKAAIKALADDKVQSALDGGDIAAARVALRDAVEKIGTFDSIQGAAGNQMVFDAKSHQGLRGDNIFVWSQVKDGKLVKADLKAFAGKK